MGYAYGYAAGGFREDALGFGENPAWIIAVSLTTLWIASITNIIGLRVGKWTENLGALSTYLVGALLAAFGVVVWLRFGSATPLTIWPEWNWSKLNFWSQIAFAFGGLELGAIMGGEIRNPEKTVARAAWIAALMFAFRRPAPQGRGA